MSAGRLIAFEGVDGAGKSTALARVSERLRAQGVRVFLPRTGKEHSSRPTRMIRQLTRDPRNLELTPRAELLLYCAREAQVLMELVKPALDRGETVLLDRSLLTPVVLGVARGLSREECEGATKLASAGIEPDLTMVFDVHPRTSRLRKRLERIRTHTLGEGGRKGLAGSALKEKVREAYLQLAVTRGYPIFHVERATPDELAARVVRVVMQGKAAGTGETAADTEPRWRVPSDWSFAQALASMPSAEALFFGDGLVSTRELRARALQSDPDLVAYTLDADDPLRDAAAELSPQYALHGLVGKPLSGASDLRMRLLERSPSAAIAALRYLRDDQSDRLRERFCKSESDAVLTSLAARDDERAWTLRRAAWENATDHARALSLVACASEEAEELRNELFETSPLLGLASIRAVSSPQADAWLRRYATHAPKLVLSAIAGRKDAFAHTLRSELFEVGREVIDTVRRLDDDASFALRERALPRWPSTVAHSLLGLASDARTRALRERCEKLGAGDVHVTRRLALLDEQHLAPIWATERARERVAEVRT